MKKLSLFSFKCGGVIGLLLISCLSPGADKHCVVKLKGNVLYAVNNHNHTSLASAKTVTINKTAPVEKARPVALKTVQPKVQIEQSIAVQQHPTRKVAQIDVPKLAIDNSDKQADIYSKILELLPGTYLDSMVIVNQLLSDSIRMALNNKIMARQTDSIDYLKLCLNGCEQDSITLDMLNRLSSGEPQAGFNGHGILIAHCKDASSSANMDSVVMDVFAGSNLVATATSDKNGTIQSGGIPEGNYYVVFSRRAYAPFSLMRVNVSNTGQSYIDIPLNRQDGYLFRVFGKNAWVFITSGIILLLSIMTILAYYLAKFTSRRTVHTA
jgi:hypothetical protein